MIFPVFGAYFCGTEIHNPDLAYKEMCGKMANLVAKSGENKGKLSYAEPLLLSHKGENIHHVESRNTCWCVGEHMQLRFEVWHNMKLAHRVNAPVSSLCVI